MRKIEKTGFLNRFFQKIIDTIVISGLRRTQCNVWFLRTKSDVPLRATYRFRGYTLWRVWDQKGRATD